MNTPDDRVAWLRAELERRERRITAVEADRTELQQLLSDVRTQLKQVDARAAEAQSIANEAQFFANAERSRLEHGLHTWEQQARAVDKHRQELILTLEGLLQDSSRQREAWHTERAHLNDRLVQAEAESDRVAVATSAELGRRLEREKELIAREKELIAIVQRLEHSINVIQGSGSWRLTAPLRRLRRLFGRMGGAPPPQVPVHEPPPVVATALQPTANRTPQPAAAGTAVPTTDATPEQSPPSVRLPSDPKPRIIVAPHDALLYGAQLLALHLARTLSTELGYDVDILLHGEGPLKVEFEAAGRVHDFYSTESTPDSRRRTIEQLRKEGARIALCNTSVVGATVGLLKGAGFSVVSMIHELPGIIKRYGLEDSIASIAQHADHVVFAASVVRDRFTELTGLDARKAIVRPQGLYVVNRFKGRTAEARRELRARLGLGEHSKVMLGMGSADLRKGIDLFVEAGLQLAGRVDDVAFVWVGPQHLEEIAPTRARVAEAGRESMFVFHGPARDPDLFFAGADAYLMTSREDPFPAVVLEALDAELPVIAFDGGGGYVDLLRRGCGVLVPHLDATAMAAAIEQLLADPGYRQQVAVSGRRIIDEEFGFADYARFLVRLASSRRPTVTAIVPNYNYGHYLPRRLRSILAQTYPPHEIVFLDDASSDDSIGVAEQILSQSAIPYRIIRNEMNQGCYRQWMRGIREATGDLIWIAEADDDCALTLIEALAPSFERASVVLAYCQSKQIDEQGRELAPDYLGWTSDVDPAKWRQAYLRPGAEEIRDSLVVKNTIPNVSAVLMRKPDLSDIEPQLCELRFAGDWLVYVHLLERGDIAFVPEALNYHRRHAASVTIGQGGVHLVRENLRVQRYVLERHRIAPEVDRIRDLCLQTTYEYLGLHLDGPASYKDCEYLKPELVSASS